MCQKVCDRAMQAMAAWASVPGHADRRAFAYGRYIRFADGPDAVHMSQLAKWTIARALADEPAAAEARRHR
jgi:acyl-CoA dehydrogenase